MIIELARTLGVGVIAEGIETQEQAEALVGLECDYGQGFHLGRPEPVNPALLLRPAA
jgi:EAL domain-containing protein (putative c-di-GMP-specific phosphodiesterase class I)